MYTNASITAWPFFEQHGFAVVAEFLAGLCAAALLLAVPVSRDLTRRTTTTAPGAITAR